MKGIKKSNKSTLASASALVLSAALFIFGSYTQTAQANWAADYVGTPSFKPSDHPKIKELKAKVGNVKNKLQEINVKISQLEKQTKNLKAKRKELKSQKDGALAKKTKLAEELKAFKAELPSLTKKQKELKHLVSIYQGNLDAWKMVRDSAKKQIAAIKAEEKCVQDPENKNCRKRIKKFRAQLKEAKEAIPSQKELLKVESEKLKVAEAALAKAKTKIAANPDKIAKLEEKITATKVQLKATKEKLATAKENLLASTEDKTQKTQRLTNLKERLKNRRQTFISMVLKANKNGARTGRGHGQSEGLDLAQRRGAEYGNAHGHRDGKAAGIRSGQQSSYRQGAARGRVQGLQEAQSDGERNGRVEGTRLGNTDAGRREGTAEGLRLAENSDATQVGEKQGREAGFQRAVREGRQKGTPVGERQGVQKHETNDLKTKTIFGPFAGAFGKEVPGFPPNFRGPFWSPSPHENKWRRMAYMDGYKFRYRRASRRFYDSKIAEVYNGAYNNSYNRLFNDYSNRDYPVHRQRGFETARTNTYNENYPRIYQDHLNQYRNQFAANPDRGSSTYKNVFKSFKDKVYARRYEEIRLASYRRVERQTFQENIAQQTEKFRQKRFDQVDAIYKNNSVLKFSGSSITDVGIQGVGKRDGIYQPTEEVLHDVQVVNYGQKKATDVTVRIDGKTFQVPELAPRSITTVKGAAKSQISNASIGSEYRLRASLVQPLSNHRKIRGRHFYSVSEGVLANDRKKVHLQYPLALSGLSSASQILFRQVQKMNITITNNSTRDYEGPLEFTLTSDALSQIVTKNWSSVSELSSSKNLSDAEVFVDDERDGFKTLSFSVVVSKNGVKLGELKSGFSTMVKAPYVEKDGEIPVVIVDSDKNYKELKTVMTKLGGHSQVSVLDTSLAEHNKATLQGGFNNKILMILDDGKGSVVNKIKAIVSKSIQSSLVFLDSKKASLGLAMKKPEFKDATRLPFFITGFGKTKMNIVFVNPIGADVQSHLPAFQVSMDNFLDYLQLADFLRLGPSEHLDRINEELDSVSYFEPSVYQAQLAETYNMMAIGQVFNINTVYDKSGSFFGGNKKIAKLVSTDQELYKNKIRQRVNVLATEETLGVYMFSFGVIYALEGAKKISGRYLTNRVKQYILNDKRSEERKLRKTFSKPFYKLHSRTKRENDAIRYNPLIFTKQ